MKDFNTRVESAKLYCIGYCREHGAWSAPKEDTVPQ